LVGFTQRLGEIDPIVCREHIESVFSVDRMVDGYLELYDRAMSKKNGHAVREMVVAELKV